MNPLFDDLAFGHDPETLGTCQLASNATLRLNSQKLSVLTQRGSGVLLRLERMMDDAARQLSVAGVPAPAPVTPSRQQTSVQRPDTIASAGSATDGSGISKN